MKSTDKIIEQIKRENFPGMSNFEIEELMEKRAYEIKCGRAPYEYYDKYGYDEYDGGCI